MGWKITLGCAIFALGFDLFLEPNSLNVGGMSGLAMILRELLGFGSIGVSGLGLMLGIQTEKNAADIIAACREKGVLVIKAKDKLRLLPALNIPMDQLAKAIAVIKECCAG